jgi:hypothetical protein
MKFCSACDASRFADFSRLLNAIVAGHQAFKGARRCWSDGSSPAPRAGSKGDRDAFRRRYRRHGARRQGRRHE